jgi:hypothetical protein
LISSFKAFDATRRIPAQTQAAEQRVVDCAASTQRATQDRIRALLQHPLPHGETM